MVYIIFLAWLGVLLAWGTIVRVTRREGTFEKHVGEVFFASLGLSLASSQVALTIWLYITIFGDKAQKRAFDMALEPVQGIDAFTVLTAMVVGGVIATLAAIGAYRNALTVGEPRSRTLPPSTPITGDPSVPTESIR